MKSSEFIGSSSKSSTSGKFKVYRVKLQVLSKALHFFKVKLLMYDKDFIPVTHSTKDIDMF